jgi:hypothetical protein
MYYFDMAVHVWSQNFDVVVSERGGYETTYDTDPTGRNVTSCKDPRP